MLVIFGANKFVDWYLRRNYNGWLLSLILGLFAYFLAMKVHANINFFDDLAKSIYGFKDLRS